MSLFSATNQERPYEQLLNNWTEPRISECGENPPFLLKSVQFLLQPERDEKTRGRGKRKVSTTNFKGEYVKTRCLRNQRFLSSD